MQHTPNPTNTLAQLLELRQRLLKTIVLLGLIFIPCAFFANHLYRLLALPVLKRLPHGQGMISIDITAPFLTPFKFATVTAVFLVMPYFLYQLWHFIAPALYQRERRLAFGLFLSSVILFYFGTAFAYVVVLPLALHFFIHAAPSGVVVYPDITHYLDFALTLFFAFGLAFEVPIATFLVVRTGMVSHAQLASKRPYLIVLAFVVGMLLTPPDIISQILLAVPLWGLFELGLLLSRLLPAPQNTASLLDL